MEDLLRRIDYMLGLSSIDSLFWLLFVAVVFFISILLSEFFNSRDTLPLRTRYDIYVLTLLLAVFSSLFTLCSFIISYLSGYYYNIYVVLGLIAQIISLCILAILKPDSDMSSMLGYTRRFILHLSTIIIIFLVSGRWLIRGVDAEETSADTLNIYYNGNFQYSRHAGWYDLAPVDSIIKVFLLRINGNSDPFSSFETFLISFTSGVFLYLLVYVYVKSKHSLTHLLPLIPAILMLHPYSFLPGLYVTPANISVALALASLIVLLYFTQNNSRANLISSRILFTTLFITSLLAHPFAISVLIFIAIYILAKYYDGSLRMNDILIFAIALTLWLAKAVHTATLYGIVSIWNTILHGIFNIWERESIIAFRNIGYSSLPKISLASFSASLGIIGGLAVLMIFYIIRRHTSNSKWLNLSIIFFVGLTGLVSLLGSLGGYSRYVLVPFASLFFLVILLNGEARNISYTLKALITIAAILVILSPNFMPDQYYSFMAAKFSDRMMFEISESLFEKLDPAFVVSRFQSTSYMKLYIAQESEFIRNMGGAGLIVDKLILSGIVEVKSYWDFVGRGPFDAIEGDWEYSMYNILWDTGIVKVLSSWTSP
ncbi:MAG: hypothetical protein QXO93_05255 [Acidilobaceae archaeon]